GTFLEFLQYQTGEQIIAAPCGESDDEMDRPVWKVSLRMRLPCGKSCEQEYPDGAVPDYCHHAFLVCAPFLPGAPEGIVHWGQQFGNAFVMMPRCLAHHWSPQTGT